MKVLLIAEKFPNKAQPWFANTAAQIIANGGRVMIISLLKGDEQYTSSVDEYSLINSTKYIKIYGLNLALMVVSNLVNPVKLIETIRGFFKYKSDPLLFPSLLKRILYRVALAPLCIMDDVDIVHSHFEMTGYRFLPLVESMRVPFVVTFHGLTPPGVPTITPEMRAKYTKKADLILLNTEFAKYQYVSLGADEKKIQVLPQGTDTNKFTYIDRSFGDGGCVQLLSVGRLSVEKGHAYTIHAINQLRKSKIDVRLKIVGQGPDLEMLEKLINDLGLQEFVELETNLSEDELIKRYQNADIFVLSSISFRDSLCKETQGVVIQEAQASGAVVVATRVGGIPESIDHGVNGLLVDERSSTQIAEKVHWLIQNQDRWSQIRLKARRNVEENYSIDLIGKKLFRLYKSLIVSNGEN